VDTFPFDSWEEALAEGGAYFTGGTGDSAVVLAVLGIIMSLYWGYAFVTSEAKRLDEAAAKLSDKYRGDS
jgi:hypothetical protein